MEYETMEEWFCNTHYIIDGNGNFRKAKSEEEYFQNYYSGLRQIELTQNDEVSVSTIFLGNDHNYGLNEDSTPILFETMVFGGEYNELCFRYRTLEEARTGHKDVCWRVFHKVGAK
jgi:hypothetical protein